jgi:hypothetical protein
MIRRIVLLFLVAGFFLASPALAADKRIEDYLPAKCPGGWVREEKPATYTPKDLYKYINGEAEMYLPYGFTRAATVAYLRPGDKENAIVANIYRMGSLLDAFGIYGNYRSPETEQINIGGEGFVEESQLMFYQDRYFVQIMASGKIDDPAAFKRCAAAISKGLPGRSRKPAELGFLKIPGAAKRSEKYYAQGLLGYGFFGKGMTVEVKRLVKPVKAFVIFTSSRKSVKPVFDAYAKHLEESKGSPRVSSGSNGLNLQGVDPLYKGILLRQAGRYIVGVAGLTDESEGQPIVNEILKRLPKQ